MILVTGANGRIGNELVRELNAKYGKVKALTRKTSSTKSVNDCCVEYVMGDVTDVESLEKVFSEKYDVVFHLAGLINITNKNKDLTYSVNIQGTKNIADICLRTATPLIYTSSIHAITAPENGSIIDETTPLQTDETIARGYYDYSKAKSTEYILEKQKEGLQAVIVHPTGVIGPNDYTPSQFGKGMISLIKSGVKFNIDGSFDYVDVRDVVSGMITAFEKNKYGERYILSSQILTMRDYTNYIKEFTGIKSNTILLGYKPSLFLGYIMNFLSNDSQITPYSVRTLHSNCNISHEKATKELRYNPRPVKDSLFDQYEWFKKNGYLE